LGPLGCAIRVVAHIGQNMWFNRPPNRALGVVEPPPLTNGVIQLLQISKTNYLGRWASEALFGTKINLLLQLGSFILNEHKSNVLHLVQNIVSYLNSWQRSPFKNQDHLRCLKLHEPIIIRSLPFIYI
jgi:hypothetical protein